jgi:anti-sigma regulatory factor (Ser/Thr protein kinase)
MSLPIDSAKTCRLYYNNAVQHEAAGILVRSKLFAIGQRLGFSDLKRQNMALVAAEMVSNQLKYAGGRGMIQVWEQPGPVLDILALDYGPGIADLKLAQQDGYSSTNTLGKGLGSIQRLADEIYIHTQAASAERQGKVWTGTAVLARFGKGNNGTAGSRTNTGLFARALVDERFNGDRLYLQATDNGLRWLHLDGLGHGQSAQSATANLASCLMENEQPEAMLQTLHERLRESRGAVAILADLDLQSRQLVLHGIGDMQAYVVQGDALQRLSFGPGVLGKEYRPPMPQVIDLAAKATVITASDGIRRSWDEAAFPGLFHQHPQLIAYVLGNIMGRISDDQSLCVVRLP